MNHQKQRPPILRLALVGLCVGVVSCTLLLLAAALLFHRAHLPTEAAAPVSIAAVAISALVAGWVTARCAGKKGLLVGSLCGLTLFLILLFIGLARGGVDPTRALIKAAGMLLGGAIGGVLGVNRKHR